MIQELSYRKRIQSIDILTMESVAACNTTIQKSTPKETIEQLKILFSKIALPPRYKITKESLKSLYDHSFDGDIDFAALSVITEILDNGIVLSHWGKAHKIKDETSVIAAPIEINNERYYAVLICGKKKDGFRYPYAIRVFSDVFIKDELLKIYRTSTQGSNTSHQNADFQKFAANLLINYILTNSDLSFLTDEAHNKADIAQNISVDKDGNYVAAYGHGADFVSENNRLNCNRNMNKKLIRLTESDLHRIVKESVEKILNEAQLNELDPRTYASAAEKARMRGQFDRAKKFKNTAADSWNREFGDAIDGHSSRFVDSRDYDGMESLGNGEVYISNRTEDGEYGNSYHPTNSEYGQDSRMHWTVKNANGPWELSSPKTRGEKVASQMVRGNGKYVKGKGWQ